MSYGLTWVGQSSFLLHSPLANLGVDLFLRNDPRLRQPSVDIDGIGHLDAAFATHEHSDHLDIATLRQLQAQHPHVEVIVPAPLASDTISHGLTNVIGAHPGIPLVYGDITVVSILSQHAVHHGEGYHFGQPMGRFLGYVFKMGAYAVYHSGDTLVYDGLVDALLPYHITAMLLPINGRGYFREQQDLVGNMNPEDAVLLTKAVGAEFLVPMHFETYPENLGDVGQTVHLAYKAGVTVLVPRYGQRVPLDWN